MKPPTNRQNAPKVRARYDMIDVPVTHFKPSEINTSWELLTNLGYTHDVDGNPLTNDEQILELYQ